jgi:hypothetical protein
MVAASAAQNNTASVAGDWDIRYTNSRGTHSASMRLEQTGERIKGTVRGEEVADGVIEGRVERNRFAFGVRFYDSDRRLGSPTECSATVDAHSMNGRCSQHRQDWTARRRS